MSACPLLRLFVTYDKDVAVQAAAGSPKGHIPRRTAGPPTWTNNTEMAHTSWAQTSQVCVNAPLNICGFEHIFITVLRQQTLRHTSGVVNVPAMVGEKPGVGDGLHKHRGVLVTLVVVPQHTCLLYTSDAADE